MVVQLELVPLLYRFSVQGGEIGFRVRKV